MWNENASNFRRVERIFPWKCHNFVGKEKVFQTFYFPFFKISFRMKVYLVAYFTSNSKIPWKYVKHILCQIKYSIYSVKIMEIYYRSITVWKLRKFTSTLFEKNLVKPTYLLRKLLNSWFDEISFQWECRSHFFDKNFVNAAS